MTTARLIYDNPNLNPDLFYATRFLTVDKYAFFEVNGKKYLLIDTLEYIRAKKNAKVDKVLLVNDYKENVEIRKEVLKDTTDILDTVFKKLKVKKLEVPESFPVGLAKELEKRHYKFTIGLSPFFPKRNQKTPADKKLMINVQRDNYKMFALVEGILRESKIKGNRLYYNGEILTSDYIKKAVAIKAIDLHLDISVGPLVICGRHGVDIHWTKNHPIEPHQPIIFDLWPMSRKTHYCGDATRTFCKGKPSPELQRMYDTVKQGQELGIKTIKAGVNAKTVHEKIMKFFESKGYKTGEKDGIPQGFIHSTGHGIGILTHEYPPFINFKDCILKEGHVSSVEPGLYYKGIGGVRIEDLVYVTKTGCEVLSHYPKKLEVI